MTAEKLRDLMYRHTKALLDLTQHYMEDDKSKTSTRACLRGRICDVEAQIVGIEDRNLKSSRRS